MIGVMEILGFLGYIWEFSVYKMLMCFELLDCCFWLGLSYWTYWLLFLEYGNRIRTFGLCKNGVLGHFLGSARACRGSVLAMSQITCPELA